MHSDVTLNLQFQKLWKQTSLLLDKRSGGKTLILKTSASLWPDGTVNAKLKKAKLPTPGSCLICWKVSTKIVTALYLISWKDGLWYTSFVVIQAVCFTFYPDEGRSYNFSNFSGHLLSCPTVVGWKFKGLGHNVLFPNDNARWCPYTSKKPHSLASAWKSQKRWKEWSDMMWYDVMYYVCMCLCVLVLIHYLCP